MRLTCRPLDGRDVNLWAAGSDPPQYLAYFFLDKPIRRSQNRLRTSAFRSWLHKPQLSQLSGRVFDVRLFSLSLRRRRNRGRLIDPGAQHKHNLSSPVLTLTPAL